MGIPFITMDAHNIVNDNVAQGCGYPNRGQIVEISAEGPVVSFETNVEAPLVSLEAQIVATQEGSGTPSPSNVRPISGFNEVTIHHNSNEVEVQLGQTVYGGSLNVTTGELTINSQLVLLKECSHRFVTGQNTINFSVPEYLKVAHGGKLGLCDTLNCIAVTGWGSISDNEIGFLNTASGETSEYVRAKIPNLTSLAEYEEWLENNNPSLLVYLATPITVQLSPVEINTIIGINDITANTGDVKLTYIRVIK